MAVGTIAMSTPTRAPIRFRAAATAPILVAAMWLSGGTLWSCGDGSPGQANNTGPRNQARADQTPPADPQPIGDKAPAQPDKPKPLDPKPDASEAGTGKEGGPDAKSEAPAPKFAKIEVKPNTGLSTTQATIGGKKFKLEIAATPESRKVGMMARESIDANGGMVFVFPASQFVIQSFWMGDCLTDMDILFLDSAGRIMTMHEMKVDRRLEGEPEILYNARLKKYSSRYRCGLVVELAPGSIKKLALKEGDLVKLDLSALKKLAK